MFENNLIVFVLVGCVNRIGIFLFKVFCLNIFVIFCFLLEYFFIIIWEGCKLLYNVFFFFKNFGEKIIFFVLNFVFNFNVYFIGIVDLIIKVVFGWMIRVFLIMFLIVEVLK